VRAVRDSLDPAMPEKYLSDTPAGARPGAGTRDVDHEAAD